MYFGRISKSTINVNETMNGSNHSVARDTLIDGQISHDLDNLSPSQGMNIDTNTNVNKMAGIANIRINTSNDPTSAVSDSEEAEEIAQIRQIVAALGTESSMGNDNNSSNNNNGNNNNNRLNKKQNINIGVHAGRNDDNEESNGNTAENLIPLTEEKEEESNTNPQRSLNETNNINQNDLPDEQELDGVDDTDDAVRCIL